MSITVRPDDPSKVDDISTLEAGWDDDGWYILANRRGGWHTDQIDLPEHPEMLAAVVRSILDPDRFATYTPRTRVALIQAAVPWMRRCGLLPRPQVDPLEDWQ